MKSRQRAFTLLELLSSMAIVGTLAALVSAAAMSAKDKGKAAKSLSNLRQIVVAIHGYAGDNSDQFPPGYFYQPGKSETTYITALLPYLGESPTPLSPPRNIFIAPTSSLPVPAKPITALIPLTYSVHGLLCPDTSNGAVCLRRSAVARPSQVILIGDGAQNPSSRNALCSFSSPSPFKQAGGAQNLDDPIPVGADSDTAQGLGQLRYRNNGSAAVAMVDGHVELMKKGTITYANIITDR